MNSQVSNKSISVLLAAAIGCALGVIAFPAMATTTALHAYCVGTTCTDNGTNTPTSTNPPTFGFSISSGPTTGNLLLDLLVPNNEVTSSSFTFKSGSNSFIASLFSTTAWTGGKLDSYLGITASPSNPIGAYLDSYLTGTQGLDKGATGFYVYQASVGSITLPSPSSTSGFTTFTVTSGIPLASYIVGYLGNSSTNTYTATANSGALFETGKPVSPVPEPTTYAMLLAGLGLIGLIAYRRKNEPSNMMMAT